MFGFEVWFKNNNKLDSKVYYANSKYDALQQYYAEYSCRVISVLMAI